MAAGELVAGAVVEGHRPSSVAVSPRSRGPTPSRAQHGRSLGQERWTTRANSLPSRNLHINFADGPARPEGLAGFRASDRYVDIGCSIITLHCSGDSPHGHAMGHAACPPGTVISKDVALGIHLHFQDEFCPAPQPSSMSPNTAGLNTTLAVDMFGDPFSPGATLVFFKDGVPTNHVFADNTTLAWFSFDHINANVTVDGSAEPGTYDVLVTDPEDPGSNMCGGCFTVN